MANYYPFEKCPRCGRNHLRGLCSPEDRILKIIEDPLGISEKLKDPILKKLERLGI